MRALQDVAALLIEGIDTPPQVAERVETAQAILGLWLDYRLDPTKGRIYDYIQDELRVDPLIPNLFWGSQKFPNPYAFAVHREGSQLPTYSIRPVHGYVHGDLHGDNVLIDRFLSSTHRLQLKIIDFAEAHPTCPMYFDHAHLELNETLRHCENVDIFRWLEFLDSLSQISHLAHLPPYTVPSSSLGPAFEAAAGIRHGINHAFKEAVGASTSRPTGPSYPVAHRGWPDFSSQEGHFGGESH
jgi:hypothetical protein